MDIIPILSTIILVATLVTLVLAVGSYLAYRLRESRRPREAARAEKPPFFRRYELKEANPSKPAGDSKPSA